MYIIKKIINSNMIWAVIAVIINCLINFLIVPYITEHIGIEAYGFVTLANNFITYVDVIAIALNSFACRYIAVEYHRGNLKNANKYYSSLFFANVLLSIIISIPALLFIVWCEKIIQISPHLVLDVKILFIIVFARYFTVLIRNAFDVSTFVTDRLDITEKIRAASYIIQALALIVSFSFFTPKLWYVGVAAFLAAAFLLVAQIICTMFLSPELKLTRNNFSLKCIKDFITAGVWNSINNAGNLLQGGLDLLITNLMLTELLMGLVSVSKSLGTLCYTLVHAVSNSFRPKQLEAYSKGDFNVLVDRLISGMKITGCVCGVIFAGFIVCGNEFLSLWLPSQNIKMLYKLSVIVLLGDIMIGVVNPLYYVYTLTKKLKIPCFITLAMGTVNVVSMYLLIKYTSLGVYSVVLTTMVLNFIHFFDAPIYSAYCIKKPWYTFYKPIILHFINCAIMIIVMLLVNQLLWVSTTWIALILKIIILGAIGVIISLLVLTNKDEKQRILRMLSLS